MKNLEKDKFEKLLEIVQNYPNIRIAHFTESGEAMIEILNNFCKKNLYEYHINCTKSAFYDEILIKYGENKHIYPINFKLSRPRYMMQGRLYEYLFVSSTVSKEERSSFIQKCHPIIKNAGNILIFLQKESYQERSHWISLLEEHNYVATNTIDDLFENYDLIISKKMHGWGG